MAQIDKPNTQFNPVLYTGNGSTQAITTGFEPDFVWCKDRTSGTPWHQLTDSVRGTNSQLFSNSTSAEETATNKLTSFDSDGFTLGSSGGINGSGQNFVSWNWKAGGTAVSNTAGTITSSVSANTDSGFSVVSYTGTGANATVGHGLGVAPKMIIVKNRSAVAHWMVGCDSIAWTNYLVLSLTQESISDSQVWNNTAPTSSVFSVGVASPSNGSGNNLIAYCFAEKKGYSKFGSYVGNGSADGNFCFTGMKPSFVMIKCTSNATDWFINDNKRLGYNGGNKVLYPDLSNAEASSPQIDILSNGFKTRTVDSMINNSGFTYIYMAFAENPLVGTNNIPTTAR